MCLRVRACDCGQYVYKTLSHSLSFQSAHAYVRTRVFKIEREHKLSLSLSLNLKERSSKYSSQKKKNVFSRKRNYGEKNSPFDFLHRIGFSFSFLCPLPPLSASNVRLQFSFMHVLFASPVFVGWFVIFYLFLLLLLLLLLLIRCGLCVLVVLVRRHSDVSFFCVEGPRKFISKKNSKKKKKIYFV